MWWFDMGFSSCSFKKTKHSVVAQHFGGNRSRSSWPKEGCGPKERRSAGATCQHGTTMHFVPKYSYISMDFNNSLCLDQLSTAIACHAAVVCTMRGW